MPAGVEPPGPPGRAAEPALDSLRQILLSDQVAKTETLEAGLARLERQMHDEGFLVRMIAPVLGDAIRLKIQEARDEMIEALYPIIGRVVQRAVAEAINDLARSLDAQVKGSFDPRLAWWRLQARFGGASEAHIRLRERLPFAVSDVLLIHRESGLLLDHLSGEQGGTADSDLFSGMLTAIRDFSQDTLGGGEETGLGEITYGDRRILIEAARAAYLAVIVSGLEPPTYRAEMRERLAEIEHAQAETLRDYQGDSAPLAPVKDTLAPLLVTTAPKKLSATQKRVLAAGLAGLVALLVGCGLLASWAWRVSRPPAPAVAAAPVVLVVTATPGPPTATPAPTLTPEPTRTTAPTLTPEPARTAVPTTAVPATDAPAPVVGVLLGNVWMHTGPAQETDRIGLALTLGEVEVLALDGGWVRVRRMMEGQNEVTGWIPLTWLGLTGEIPAYLITPEN